MKKRVCYLSEFYRFTTYNENISDKSINEDCKNNNAKLVAIFNERKNKVKFFCSISENDKRDIQEYLGYIEKAV